MSKFLNKLTVPVLASAPGSPAEGMVYENSTDHQVYYYNGTGWKVLAAQVDDETFMLFLS